MTAFTDYITPETIASIRAKVLGYAQAVGLFISNWIPGGVGQQTFEAVSQALLNSAGAVAALTRGYASLDTSTDPGDVDPYDPTNVTLPPSPGFLSAKGLGDFGTPRIGSAFATGPFTLANASGFAVSFAPGSLTFTRSAPFPNVAYSPTYYNAPDPTIYTNPDGTVTVSNGASLTFTISAFEIGTLSNDGGGGITLTTVLAPTGITGSNGAVLGSDRQAADAYRVTCRQAAALTSPNGPGDSYRYLATTARSDGTYGASTTGVSVGVTGVYVSQDSSTGIVQIFLKGASGQLSAPNTAIVATLILLSPGVVAAPDALTILVGVQSGPDAGKGCSDTTIGVTYAAKMLAAKVPGGASPGTYTSGGGPPAPVAAVFTAIAASLAAYLSAVPIGGFSQTAGAGFVYTDDLRVAIAGAVNASSGLPLGIYGVTTTVPAGASTVIALGNDAIIGSVSGTLVLE